MYAASIVQWFRLTILCPLPECNEIKMNASYGFDKLNILYEFQYISYINIKRTTSDTCQVLLNLVS